MLRSHPISILSGIFIAALIASGEVALAQNDATSANYLMPRCRAFIGPASRQDRCTGIVEGLVFAGKDVGVCAPRASTLEQSIRIVLQYIESRPAKRYDNFIALALEALKARWPCKN